MRRVSMSVRLAMLVVCVAGIGVVTGLSSQPDEAGASGSVAWLVAETEQPDAGLTVSIDSGADGWGLRWGSTAEFTYTVANTGGLDLTAVVVEDSAAGTVGQEASLPVGGSRTFTRSFVVGDSVQGVVRASAMASENGMLEASVEYFEEVYIAHSFPDYGVRKVAGVSSAAPGDAVTYRLYYRNHDEAPAGEADFTLVDEFDGRYASVADAGGGTVAGTTITWSFSGITPADGERFVEYSLRISPDAPAGALVRNTATIRAYADLEPSNDVSSASVLVVAPSGAGEISGGGGTAAGTGRSPAAEPYLPFTEAANQAVGNPSGEPFLPFTGADERLMPLALLFALTGVGMRRFASRRLATGGVRADV